MQFILVVNINKHFTISYSYFSTISYSYFSVKPFSQISFPPTLGVNTGMEKPISSPSGGLIQCANGSTNIGNTVLQPSTPTSVHNNSVSHCFVFDNLERRFNDVKI